MNRTVMGLIPYMTKEISRLARQDPSVIDLSLGEPWFGPPPQVMGLLGDGAFASRAAFALKAYAPSIGSERLRSAISCRYGRLYGLEVKPETDLLITLGGSEGVANAVAALTEIGDEVLLLDPTYMLYERSCSILGRVPLRVPQQLQFGAAVDMGMLQNCCTARTRAIIINSPENPTGNVWSGDELQELVRFCLARHIWLIHDEVYDAFVYEGVHVSAAAFDPERRCTVLVNSCSKKFGVPGLRIGWLVASPPVIEQCSKVHDYFSMSVSAVSQLIAEEILADPATDVWCADRLVELAARREVIRTGLTAAGIHLPEQSPRGAFFAFADVSGVVSRLPERYREPDEEPGSAVARYLFDVLKIAVVPGGIYGRCGAPYIRAVFAVEAQAIESAVQRLIDWRP